MTQEDRKRLLKYLGVRLFYGVEDKDLLLQDLCGRLPYGVMALIHNAKGNEYNINIVGGDIDLFSHQFITIKPYLRPMSSMTEEERKEYEGFIIHREHVNAQGQEWDIDCFSFDGVPRLIDWLNANHFDYRGLIEKSLALEAPEGMYGKDEK